MIRLAALLCLLASPAFAGYCDDWREFRDGATVSTVNEFWAFALAKYCNVSRETGLSLTPDMVAVHVEDWRGRCASEYRTWDASTATVVRRISHGKRVICPLPR